MGIFKPSTQWVNSPNFPSHFPFMESCTRLVLNLQHELLNQVSFSFGQLTITAMIETI